MATISSSAQNPYIKGIFDALPKRLFTKEVTFDFLFFSVIGSAIFICISIILYPLLLPIISSANQKLQTLHFKIRKKTKNPLFNRVLGIIGGKMEGLEDCLKYIRLQQEGSSHELITADMDYAFQLQMQEFAGSMSSSTSSSSSSSRTTTATTKLGVAQIVADKFAAYERERRDRELAELEASKMSEDLNRMIHDQAFAREILFVPEAEWKNKGAYYERPYVEGSTTWTAGSFRVYFKGLVRLAVGQGVREMRLAGAGVVICDANDCPIFELWKPLELTPGDGEVGVEFKALIEGLNAAVTLGLKRVHVLFDNDLLHQYITGKGPPRKSNIVTLVDQVSALQKKFVSCNVSLVGKKEVRFAFKLARDAIVSQATKYGKKLFETCTICTEDVDARQIFSIDKCLHQYCFSCMKRYVESKLFQGKLPECPHEGCKTKMKIQSCKTFLTSELYAIMSNRIKEASIPSTEKIYCPYPTCSALMSIKEVLGDAVHCSADAQEAGARKCMSCHNFFCINCKVPWHVNMTCLDYKKENPHPSEEDAELNSLATKSSWRQCVKCRHMVELAHGCYHIYCRCGYEFCYTCGAEWKNKKATCKCPVWDERNIVYAEGNRRRPR